MHSRATYVFEYSKLVESRKRSFLKHLSQGLYFSKIVQLYIIQQIFFRNQLRMRFFAVLSFDWIKLTAMKPSFWLFGRIFMLEIENWI